MYNNKCSRYQIEVTRPKQPKWGFSSAGRAPALHAGGQEFESPNLHHLKSRAERLFFCCIKELYEEDIFTINRSHNICSTCFCGYRYF